MKIGPILTHDVISLAGKKGGTQIFSAKSNNLTWNFNWNKVIKVILSSEEQLFKC
jgi:hypothetical protein